MHRRPAWGFPLLGSCRCLLRDLRPLPKQRHQTSTKKDADHHEGQPLIILRSHRVKQKVPSKQLNQSSVD